VFGAPVVCLIGGTYMAALLGGGRTACVVAAGLLLLVVVALTLGGARTTSTAQLGLVAVLIALVGPVVAAIAAVALTLAATNAYLSGAVTLAAEMRARRRPCASPSRSLRLQLGIATAGVLLLGGQAAGVVTTAQLVAIPTTLFLTVHVGCTAAAARLLTGRARVAAAVSCATVVVVMAFGGWALTAPLVIVVAACARRFRGTRLLRAGGAVGLGSSGMSLDSARAP
jgi:amino acid efflux transporter